MPTLLSLPLGHLTEDLPTDTPRLAQSLQCPNLPTHTLVHRASPDPAPDPGPRADQGILCLFLFVIILFSNKSSCLVCCPTLKLNLWFSSAVNILYPSRYLQ